MFIPPLYTTAKIRKQPKCPATDEWMKKMGYITQYFSAMKKEGNLFVTTWMDLEHITLNEIIQRMTCTLRYHL